MDTGTNEDAHIGVSLDIAIDAVTAGGVQTYQTRMLGFPLGHERVEGNALNVDLKEFSIRQQEMKADGDTGNVLGQLVVHARFAYITDQAVPVRERQSGLKPERELIVRIGLSERSQRQEGNNQWTPHLITHHDVSQT